MAAEGLFLVIPWEVVESIDRATIRLAERITSLSAPKPRPLGPFGHPAPAGLTSLNFPSILTRQGHKSHLLANFHFANEAGLSPAGGAGRFSLNAHSPGSDLSLGYHGAAGRAAEFPCAMATSGSDPFVAGQI